MLVLSACRHGPSDADLRRTFDAANLAFLQGELKGARALAEAGLSKTAAQADSPWSWRFRLLRADILVSERDLTEVRPLVDVSLPAGAAFDALRARQKFLQARVMLADRRLDAALALATSAGETASGDQALAFDARSLAGQILFQTGRWDEGEAILTRTARAAAESRDRYHEAFALHQLGMGQFVRNRFDQALMLFERVLAFSDLSAMGIYAKALNNAGMCYARLGQFDRAVAVQRQAVEAQSKSPRSAEFEQALGQLGNSLLMQKDIRQGTSYVRRAFEVARDGGIAADAALWAGNLSHAHIENRQWDEADRYNEEARRLSASTRGTGSLYFTLRQAAIASGRGEFDAASRLYDEALHTPNVPPAVAWNAHAGLADVAMARNDPSTAATHFEAALAVIERTRSDLLKTDYKLSYLTQLIAFYRAYVDALMRQGLVERALEIADSSRSRVLEERQGGKASARVAAVAIRSLAKQTGTVFLSFWLTPARSYVWVITGGGVRCHELPPAGTIETLVRAHQASIANALSDPLIAGGPGSELYRLLIAPVLPDTTPGARVLIVPDGSLHALNFETLPVDGARPHYFIEDAEIQVAPSLASMRTTANGTGRRSLLLIGNPVPRAPEYPALAYASAEMASVARHFGSDVTSFDGARATPASYRAETLDRFAFVHFTAHATANVDSPLDSAVILSGPDDGYKLYARDVAARALAADVVTVSACRSAGERAYAGEGLIGFSWAFLRAGARRVVAGLWDVDDRSTAELMDRMYGALAEGQSPARALRTAKLALIAELGPRARPYNWGALEMFTTTP